MGEVGRWCMLPGTKRVKDSESFKASTYCKRSLKTSWPSAFIIHYSLSFTATRKSSSDIKHCYILGRHKQNNSLPCPEIALFFFFFSSPCNLASPYFWSQICPQSNCIFRAGEMLVWIIDSHLYEAHTTRRAAGSFVNRALQLCQQNAAQASLYMFTVWWVIMGQG